MNKLTMKRPSIKVSFQNGLKYPIWSMLLFSSSFLQAGDNIDEDASLSISSPSFLSAPSSVNSSDDDEIFTADKGGDLDQYLRKSHGPLTFNIEIKRHFGEVDSEGRLKNIPALIAQGVIEKTATLELRVWDVDDDSQEDDIFPERDKVKINGYPLKNSLVSGNDLWSTVSYQVPVEHLLFPEKNSSPKPNKIEIMVDLDNQEPEWAVKIDWGKLEVKGLRPLVLIHGYRGSGLSGGVPASWDKFAAYLRSKHIPFCVPGDGICSQEDPIDGLGCIDDNGQAINHVVDDVREQWGVNKVNIVAHSKGGLDTRAYLRYHDLSGARTDSVIQLGTPNHGSTVFTGLRLSCANQDLSSFKMRGMEWDNDQENLSFTNYSETLYWKEPEWPDDNGGQQVEWMEYRPLYRTEENFAKKGLFRSAIGSQDRFVDKRSATPPWRVDCTEKKHLNWKKGCLSADGWHITWPKVTWPTKVRLDAIFPGIGHSADSFTAANFDWIINEIRQMTGLASSTTRKRPLAQQQSSTQPLPSPTFKEYVLVHRQTLDILAGEVHSHVIPIDVVDSVVFLVDHDGGSEEVTVSLKDPNGLIHQAQKHPDFPIGLKRFEIPNPIPGQWRLIVQSLNNLQYGFAAKVEGSPIDFRVQYQIEYSSGDSDSSGDSVRFFARLTNTSIPILGATVTVEISRPSSSTSVQSLTLYDDGTHGDLTPADGIYANNEYVVSQEEETPLSFYVTDGMTFQRQLDRTLRVIRKKAQFTNVYTENTVDKNGDGLYDELVIGVEVNFSKVTSHRIYASLEETDGSLINVSYTRFTPPSVGNHTVFLHFTGQEIFEHGVNGPYQLGNLALEQYNVGMGHIIADVKGNAYTTNAYQATQFQRDLIRLFNVDKGFGVDNEADGFFNYLVILLEVDVVRRGNYQANARLMTLSGKEIGWSHPIDLPLESGKGSIPLLFDGKKIRQTEENGPYLLKNLVITGEGKYLGLVDNEYRTATFGFKDFQPIPLTDFAIDKQDLSVSASNVLVGKKIELSALVRNVGKTTTKEVVVRFYQGNPFRGGIPIGDDQIISGLATGQTARVSEHWTAPSPSQKYDLYVWVNKERDITEFDYNNNYVFQTVMVNSEKLLVELAHFVATAIENKVYLNWETASEENVAQFILWRGHPLQEKCLEGPNNYTHVRPIASVNAQGTSVETSTYSEMDSHVTAGETYCYLLEEIEFDGNRNRHWNRLRLVTIPR